MTLSSVYEIGTQRSATTEERRAVKAIGLRDRTTLNETASVLARSFQESPNVTFACSDPTKRARVLRHFFRAVLKDALTYGQVDVATSRGDVVGVAVWLPPEHVVMSPARQARVALPFVQTLLVAPRASTRLARLGGKLSSFHPREPHWYLAALGVDESARGQGVGSSLIAAGIARAERTGTACYLETMTEPNVRLYEKHAFRVTHREPDLLPGGPPFWFMWRTPGATSARATPPT